jgi:hypothetical protein
MLPCLLKSKSIGLLLLTLVVLATADSAPSTTASVTESLSSYNLNVEKHLSVAKTPKNENENPNEQDTHAKNVQLFVQNSDQKTVVSSGIASPWAAVNALTYYNQNKAQIEQRFKNVYGERAISKFIQDNGGYPLITEPTKLNQLKTIQSLTSTQYLSVQFYYFYQCALNPSPLPFPAPAQISSSICYTDQPISTNAGNFTYLTNTVNFWMWCKIFPPTIKRPNDPVIVVEYFADSLGQISLNLDGLGFKLNNTFVSLYTNNDCYQTGTAQQPVMAKNNLMSVTVTIQQTSGSTRSFFILPLCYLFCGAAITISMKFF